LFLVGMEFDLRNLKYLGKDLFIITTIQTVVFFGIAYYAAVLFGFSAISAVHLAILFIFGSTLLVAKWVEDKNETKTLHGKLVLGILVMQDLFAVIALTLLSIFSEPTLFKVLLVPAGGVALLAIAFVFAKYLLNPLLKFTARYPELMFIFGLGVCFFFVQISPLLGYSTTIGAFIAGVTLANTNYKNDIYSRLKPLVIFFNMLFFVGLGFQLSIDATPHLVLFTVLLCLAALTLKPLVSYITMKIRGYDMKTSFIVSVYLAQLSEFGIIIIAGSAFAGSLPGYIGAIAIVSVIVTMVASSYYIRYDKKMFGFFEGALTKIDSFFPKKELGTAKLDADYNVVIFGFHDIGRDVVSRLQGFGKKILVVENDPSSIDSLKRQGITFLYGSAATPYFFDQMDFSSVEIVVSSCHDLDDNIMIIGKLKKENPKGVVFVTAKSVKDSVKLYDLGADYVIYPSYVNQQQISVLIEDYHSDVSKVLNKKLKDIATFEELYRQKEPTPQFDMNKFLLSLAQKTRRKKKA
ncbi:MAG: cation:proton antiporter, partial [Candidatus Woesearchaeota archaeon]